MAKRPSRIISLYLASTLCLLKLGTVSCIADIATGQGQLSQLVNNETSAKSSTAENLHPNAAPEAPIIKLEPIGGIPVRMDMSSSKILDVSMVLNPKSFEAFSRAIGDMRVRLEFRTQSPQFDILFPANQSSSVVWSKVKFIDVSKNFINTSFLVPIYADYIGHATITPVELDFYSDGNISKPEHQVVILDNKDKSLDIHVTIVRIQGIWEVIFIISVTILVLLSYVNLGAQLDVENLKKILNRPKTMIVGFLLTVVVMPAISWLGNKWLLHDQLLYRIGSFIFATTPAASASTLWTVMLEADKELSVSLQVLSTFGTLISMPLLLYMMDMALQEENSHYMIKVPYMKLIQSTLILLIALFIGWRLLGRNKRLREISSKVFKPFIFAVLLFIIVFSSTLYWFIYRMFDWTITIDSLLIAVTTYLVTGALGYLISFNLDHAITISISSAYKNSGIAFAILLVGFEAPDFFIAYIPCLTQVLVTSILLYIAYSIRLLYNWFMRRDQPAPIQATGSEEPKNDTTKSSDAQPGSADEEEEFIDVNVTDIASNQPIGASPTEKQ